MSGVMREALLRLFDDAEDVIRLARTFVEMADPRWQAAQQEMQRLEHMAGDGVALVIGARSEANIEKYGPDTNRRDGDGAHQQGAARRVHRKAAGAPR